MASFRYMVASFLLATTFSSRAQTVPWNAPAVSLVSAPLTIGCIPMVDGKSLNEGDYLGVFNDSGRCFGLACWKDTINLKITIYGADGMVDGFKTGESLSVKLWLHNENCILEHVSQVSADRPLIFSNTAANRVNVLNFEKAQVSFSHDQYCLNEGITLTPQVNYPVKNISFLSQNGLKLDPVSGIINLENSLPNHYNIVLSSDICLVSNNLDLTLNDYPRLENIPDTFICGDKLSIQASVQNNRIQWSNGAVTPRVDLTESARIWYTVTNNLGCSNSDTFDVKKMSIGNLAYKTEKADCYRKGSLTITDKDIINGKPPYIYRLANQLDNTEVSDLERIPEGIYTIEVVNVNGCVLRYGQKTVIEKDCLNDKPVFSPNDDGLDDKYFVNLEGKLEVFDRNGQLKRRLTGPCYFDGKDEKGNLLAMGVYMIVSEKRETVIVTIIR